LIGIVDSPFEQRVTKDDGTTWRINSSWDLEGTGGAFSAGTVYVNVAEGYRLGGGNTFASCPDPLPPGQNVCLLPEEESFDVDTAINYEIGAKTTWLDDSLLLNVALFYIDWQDVQIDSRSANGDVPITLNAAEAVSQGLELQTRWQINDNWAVFGSYAYTNAELSKDSPGVIGVRSAPPNEDAFKGDRLPATPEHQGSLNLNYSTLVFNGLTLDVNYGFTSISNVITKIGQRGNGETLGGFTIHNASISLSDDQWTATLYADNLTNKSARTGVRTDRDYIDSVGANDFTLRRYFHHVNRPRAVGIDFRYRFDF
jgi:iron complex outermembrane receptor protein